LARAYEVKGEALSPAATAYVRARGADPKCSFGDMVALSDTVDLGTAEFLKGVVSDGIIAPGYEPKALKLLCEKKGGSFIVLQIDAGYRRPSARRASCSACAWCRTGTTGGSRRPTWPTWCAGRSTPRPSATSCSD
jgi:AICAR transformylase/IMP cyclohydrolase PurH